MTRPESQPRHPLALLADYVEAANRHLDAPSYSGVLEEAMNDAEDALLTLDPAALRAQAEAEAGLREAAEAVLSEFHANRLRPVFVVGEPHRAWKTRVIVDRLAAALAQAGGESL